uniref:Uncharacterized protein n=1 Tax=viral metagenome TaxID=1070528 RepID=A0A6M3JX03_9ZZZZ
MTKILPCEGIAAWKASYLSKRFGITVDEARQLKKGEPVEIANTKAEKIVEQGFGRIVNAEADPVEKTETIETEADNGN